MSSWGRNFKITIFGESHGPAIGVAIEGLPAGFAIDWESAAREMARRAPGRSETATSRSEADEFEILSGYYGGAATGDALCAVIRNSDRHSDAYREFLRYPRPGHADYPAQVRYGGHNDHRGGGHFSGRLTAPLVLAGAIAKQMLASRGVAVGAHIRSIGGVQEAPFPVQIPGALLQEISAKEFAVIDDVAGQRMKQAILSAKAQGDSLGGVIECAAAGVPAGLGGALFDGVESSLASLLFAVPAVKGVEFGAGFSLSGMTGYEANDFWRMQNGKVQTSTNHNGGILGGITTGMPLVFSAAIKPTPSIARPQPTVDLEKHEDSEITVTGRHDPCIVPRAVPVVEAAAALALADVWMDQNKWGDSQ